MRKKKKKRIVAVSGGFDPLHIGHVRLFKEAKRLGDELVVILNNDNWLKEKKGYVFMPQNERKEIIESIRGVNRVVLTNHSKSTTDMSVNNALENLRPDVFANGGDRTTKNVPEIAMCKKIGCAMVYGIGRGGKVQSSSLLLKKFKQNEKKS